MSPAATSTWRLSSAKKPPKRLVSPSIARQAAAGVRSSMADPPPPKRNARDRIARDQPVRPHDHHYDQDNAVNNQPLGVLEIEEAVEEIVDLVRRIEVRPCHRQQLEPFAQCAQEFRYFF